MTGVQTCALPISNERGGCDRRSTKGRLPPCSFVKAKKGRNVPATNTGAAASLDPKADKLLKSVEKKAAGLLMLDRVVSMEHLRDISASTREKYRRHNKLGEYSATQSGDDVGDIHVGDVTQHIYQGGDGGGNVGPASVGSDSAIAEPAKPESAKSKVAQAVDEVRGKAPEILGIAHEGLGKGIKAALIASAVMALLGTGGMGAAVGVLLSRATHVVNPVQDVSGLVRSAEVHLDPNEAQP